MKTEVKLTNSIEFLDLCHPENGFKLCELKPNQRLGSAYLFDRSLYFLRNYAGSLESGADILIVGGYRGDTRWLNSSLDSILFNLSLRMKSNDDRGGSDSKERDGSKNLGFVANISIEKAPLSNPDVDCELTPMLLDKIEVAHACQFLPNTSVDCSVFKRLDDSIAAIGYQSKEAILF